MSFRIGPALVALTLCGALGAQEGRGKKGVQAPKRSKAAVRQFEAPDQPGSVMLGRPTATSITLSLLWKQDVEGLLVWGPDPEHLSSGARRIRLAGGTPQRAVLSGLAPDTPYAYALLEASSRRRLLPLAGPGRFRTARAPGQPFTFTLQADSHLDDASLPELYDRMLANVQADGPDFHIDLGDTFMTDKHPSRESAASRYTSQRYHLGLIGHSIPLFLALGNHDGEGSKRGKGAAEDLSAWSLGMRTRFFVNPVPDGFYTGNPAVDPMAGPLEDYYAWTWGDALFVILDPYWPSRRSKDPWDMTLGQAQYDWLTRTLRTSRARFKFVFIHQLTGSYHESGRGGAEAAAYQEWGGKDLDGHDTFRAHRPGWAMPIHRLLVDTGVSAVFHGHDHFYARQELDGVLYQLVPQPAHRNDRSHQAAEYGYTEGSFLASSGHLRVRVAPEQVTVEYVRAALPEMERNGVRNRSIGASYTRLFRGTVR